MSEVKMTAQAEREMDERFELQGRALDIFKLVVAEWKSDPHSVQCFDLRIVEEAKLIDAKLKRLGPLY